ncbi:tetratricopeptide repeat protein [Flavobacterium sp. XGLA_31]|uniref:tetratricopeptide repeat protein n=1 Tax=Flavobacterium sp. XGLA_31 TaxID=3447666 RepID=UPI003F3824FC
MKLIKLTVFLLFVSVVSGQSKQGYWDNVRTTNETAGVGSGDRKCIKTADFPEGTTEVVYRISLLDDNQKLSSSLVSVLKAIPDPTGISQGSAGAVFLLSTISGTDKCKYAVFTNKKDAKEYEKSGELKNACIVQDNPINKEAKLLSDRSSCLTGKTKNLWFVFESTNWVMNEKIVLEVVPWVDNKLSSGWNNDAKKEVIALCKNLSVMSSVVKKDQFCGFFLDMVTQTYSYKDFKNLLPEEKAKAISSFSEKALMKIGENKVITVSARAEAMQLFDKGKKQEAIDLLQSTLSKNVSVTTADYVLLGKYYLLTKQFGKALEILKSAEQKDPNDLTIQLNLAHAYLFMDDFTKAKEIYKQYKSQNISADVSWTQQVKADFQTFEKNNMSNPKFKRVLNILD